MKQNVLLEKTFDFAVQIVLIVQEIQKNHKEYVISRQLLKAATSIGANAEEAVAGQSQADFVAKLSIARKEARETRYWLRLLTASKIFDCTAFLNQNEEIIKIITSIILTTNLSKGKNSNS